MESFKTISSWFSSTPETTERKAEEPKKDNTNDNANKNDTKVTQEQQTTPTPTGAQELDIVFCCDCTGSMSSYIKSAQDNIRRISQNIHERATNVSVRYALVKYRDHPPQDHSFVTEVFPFTEDINKMKANIDTMFASGGGDGPEAVSAALHEVLKIDWRPNSVKICVLIADAPPHGLGERGDGFPNGCPLGTDPIQTCKALAKLGVTIYAVGVEPTLSTSFQFARDFMMMVAKVTDGKFLPLGKAEILTDVIVNGALEGVNMAEVWNKLEQEVQEEAKKKGENLTAEEALTRIQKTMESRPITMAQVEVKNPYMDSRYDSTNVDYMCNAPSLSSATTKLDPRLNSHVVREVGCYSWKTQEADCAPSVMTTHQHERIVMKSRKTKGLFEFS